MHIMSPVYFQTTIGEGQTSADFSFKIPGIYSSLRPANAGAGRHLKKMLFSSDSALIDARVTDLRLEDVDGKLSAEEQAEIEAMAPGVYPKVVRYFEPYPMTGINNGLLVPQSLGRAVIEPLNSQFNFLPAELYIMGTFRAEALKTLTCQIIWGRFIPFDMY